MRGEVDAMHGARGENCHVSKGKGIRTASLRGEREEQADPIPRRGRFYRVSERGKGQERGIGKKERRGGGVRSVRE